VNSGPKVSCSSHLLQCSSEYYIWYVGFYIEADTSQVISETPGHRLQCYRQRELSDKMRQSTENSEKNIELPIEICKQKGITSVNSSPTQLIRVTARNKVMIRVKLRVKARIKSALDMSWQGTRWL